MAVMTLEGIAIAAVVSVLALAIPAESSRSGQVRADIHTAHPEIPTSIQPSSSQYVSCPLLLQGPILLERTPAVLIAQHSSSARLRELIRRYNSDLSASQVREIAHWTEFYSHQYGIDPRLIAGLVARESGFDPKARSRTGARGLGQISAALGKDLGIRDRTDIQENLEGTTRWIRTLYDTWLADGVEEHQAIHWSLASYRQGLARTREVGIPANVARYINEVYEIAHGLPQLPAS